MSINQIYFDYVLDCFSKFKENLNSIQRKTRFKFFLLNRLFFESSQENDKVNHLILVDDSKYENDEDLVIDPEKDFYLLDKSSWNKIKSKFPNEIELKFLGYFCNKKFILEINNYIYYFYYINNSNNSIEEGYFNFDNDEFGHSIISKFFDTEINDFFEEMNIKEENAEQKIIYKNQSFIFKLKKKNKNNDINYTAKKNENFINCLKIYKFIYYYLEFRKWITNTFLEILNQKKYKFYLIDSNWINNFKTKCNLEFIKYRYKKEDLVDYKIFANIFAKNYPLSPEILDYKPEMPKKINIENSIYYENFDFIDEKTMDIFFEEFNCDLDKNNFQIFDVIKKDNIVILIYNNNNLEIILIGKDSIEIIKKERILFTLNKSENLEIIKKTFLSLNYEQALEELNIKDKNLEIQKVYKNKNEIGIMRNLSISIKDFNEKKIHQEKYIPKKSSQNFNNNGKKVNKGIYNIRTNRYDLTNFKEKKFLQEVKIKKTIKKTSYKSENKEQKLKIINEENIEDSIIYQEKGKLNNNKLEECRKNLFNDIKNRDIQNINEEKNLFGGEKNISNYNFNKRNNINNIIINNNIPNNTERNKNKFKFKNSGNNNNIKLHNNINNNIHNINSFNNNKFNERKVIKKAQSTHKKRDNFSNQKPKFNKNHSYYIENNSYINAFIKCMAYNKYLTTHLLADTNQTKFLSNETKYKLTNAYINLLKQILFNNESKKISFSIVLEKSMNEINIFPKNSENFITCFMEILHNELNEANTIIPINPNINQFNNEEDFNLFKYYMKNNYKSIISDLFYALLNSSISCANCNAINNNIQYYYILEFPLDEVLAYKKKINEINIYDCFEYYQRIKPSVDNKEIYCKNCHQMVNTSNSTYLIYTPYILMVRLKYKNNIKLQLEDTIDINYFLYAKNVPTLYELIGIVSLTNFKNNEKHYISFCKIDEKWYKFDNEKIISTFEEVKNTGIPYLLFYSGIHK